MSQVLSFICNQSKPKGSSSSMLTSAFPLHFALSFFVSFSFRLFSSFFSPSLCVDYRYPIERHLPVSTSTPFFFFVDSLVSLISHFKMASSFTFSPLVSRFRNRIELLLFYFFPGARS